jgi:hypothetical protein
MDAWKTFLTFREVCLKKIRHTVASEIYGNSRHNISRLVDLIFIARTTNVNKLIAMHDEDKHFNCRFKGR